MDIIKRGVKRAFGAVGWQLTRKSSSSADKEKGRYSGVASTAHYTPWHIDAVFSECYKKIRDFTLVDERRCYALWSLVQQTAKLSEGAILEVGVWRGGTGGLIAEQARRCGIADDVYLCDTFSGVVKAGDQDPSYFGGEHSDTSLEAVRHLLFDSLQLNNVQLLQGVFPDDTGKLVGSSRFRLCHVDVDVYQSAKDIVDWIFPKVVRGGVIVFDDYGFETCAGIQKYVDELLHVHGLIGFYNLTGQAVIVKL
jgi:O-methyltransferase